jgi:hypothetical protein
MLMLALPPATMAPATVVSWPMVMVLPAVMPPPTWLR